VRGDLGAESWVEVEEFGRAKEGWLQTFFPLPGGIPSHDTFGREFAALDPEQFEACFLAWVAAGTEPVPGEVVAVDGKCVRILSAVARSRSDRGGMPPILYFLFLALVSLFALFGLAVRRMRRPAHRCRPPSDIIRERGRRPRSGWRGPRRW
jgi:hypothetical protein